MLKKYKSKSDLSLSVVLPTGSTTHISFNPVTGGGSVFYTSNEKLQSGLESHPKYGKLFKLEEAVSENPVKKSKGATANTTPVVPDGEATGETQEDAGKALIEVKVNCNDDAKDYLADRLGISRSKLRSRAQMESVANANGIKFVWA